MKRKKANCIILFLTIIILSACSKETEEELKSIAKDGLEEETLKTCEPISDLEGLQSVTENQEYNFETDYNPSWIVKNGATDAKEQIYINRTVNYLHYYQKSTQKLDILCGKPECEHVDFASCNALIWSSPGIQYYDGFLYMVSPDEEFMLKKISIDGSERENICKLFVGGEMIDYSNSGYSINWIIHRGYIYYSYSAGNSSGSVDTFYINNSNYVFRMSLEGSNEPECIMKLPYNIFERCTLKGFGSYVYIIPFDIDDTSVGIYRYNTELEKLEWLESLGENITDCTVKNGTLYYMQSNDENTEFTLMSYDADTENQSKITSINAQAWHIYSDDDFLYLMYGLNGFQDITRVFVMTSNYDIVANIELEESNGHRSWLGTDDSCIYISRSITDGQKYHESEYAVEYIEKEDLIDGEYTIKECNY